MNKWKTIWALPALVCALAWGAAAQNNGQIGGTVYGADDKPLPDTAVVIKQEDSNNTYTLKSDKRGSYLQIGLHYGVYTLTFTTGQFSTERKIRLDPDEQKTLDIHFKEEMAANAAYQEQLKKQEEEKKKFEGMKAHFQTGRATLEQALALQGQMAHLPPDQRGTTEQKIAELSQAAISEFQAAQQAAGEKDANLYLIMANMGQAYETEGKYDEAAAAFQKAIELKPTQTNYYIALGTDLAHAGKMQEASAACDKAATLDSANAGVCWRNLGIVLVNAGKMKEAVDPLRKSTEVDPKNADGWYWLGTALLNNMSSKTVGDKIVAVIAPGTVEAYQKCLELAPNGPHAEDAKTGLETLKQLGAGMEATVKTKKKK